MTGLVYNTCATNIKVEFSNSGLSEQEATNLTTFVERCKRITSIEFENTANFKKATWRRLLKSIAYTKKNLDVFLPAAAIKPSVLTSFREYKRQFRLIVKDFENVVEESDETEDEVNGYNEVFANDEDDDISLGRILKRHDIDCYDTPVHVKRTVQNVKDTLKTSVIQADKIVKKGGAYHKLLRQIEADEYLGVTTSREDKIEELVRCIASQLTEAILLGVNSWIYLISFDIFLHGEPNMDDCAPTNSKADVMRFWKEQEETAGGIKNGSPDPLYMMARRYLAAPTSSVPSERCFSRAAIFIPQQRNRLLPSALQESVLLDSWFKYFAGRSANLMDVFEDERNNSENNDDDEA
ncbi:hypothetical protein INT45_003106 [Circinella minor]|uniref:HAT C-terminal dimerisation domain-containing protein n=1 Tax=Circinella minor TaxID=1195481 RepID=A0A8H7S100_9FUNG|nr:hypothetical protein INT45_003106 [Circinella minor]